MARRVTMAEAARLTGLTERSISRQTLDHLRGERYAATSRYKGHPEYEVRQVRGKGAGTFFKPGDRKGFPRHFDPNVGGAGRWVIELADLALWYVRRHALTPEDVGPDGSPDESWSSWKHALILAADEEARRE